MLYFIQQIKLEEKNFNCDMISELQKKRQEGCKECPGSQGSVFSWRVGL